MELDPQSGEWAVTDRTYVTEPQMYAANQMYITGIPNFAPPMVQALELRSITPETRTELAGPDEALQGHQDIMASLPSAQAEATATPASAATPASPDSGTGLARDDGGPNVMLLVLGGALIVLAGGATITAARMRQ